MRVVGYVEIVWVGEGAGVCEAVGEIRGGGVTGDKLWR